MWLFKLPLLNQQINLMSYVILIPFLCAGVLIDIFIYLFFFFSFSNVIQGSFYNLVPVFIVAFGLLLSVSE